MPVSKITISLPEDIAEAVKTSADAKGSTVSAFITQEVRRALLLAESKAHVAELEAEHGEVTREEIQKVLRWAGRSIPGY